MSDPTDDDEYEPTQPDYAPPWLRELQSERPPAPPAIDVSTFRLRRQLDRLERTMR